MNNDQNKNQIQPYDAQAYMCKLCGRSSCACPNKNIRALDQGQVIMFKDAVSQENKLEDKEQLGEKKLPKTRWI